MKIKVREVEVHLGDETVMYVGRDPSGRFEVELGEQCMTLTQASIDALPAVVRLLTENQQPTKIAPQSTAYYGAV